MSDSSQMKTCGGRRLTSQLNLTQTELIFFLKSESDCPGSRLHVKLQQTIQCHDMSANQIPAMTNWYQRDNLPSNAVWPSTCSGALRDE